MGAALDSWFNRVTLPFLDIEIIYIYIYTDLQQLEIE